MITTARDRLRHTFTDHPASVDETWREHFSVAFGFARTLAVAAGGAMVHAVVPAWCERTASRRIVELHERISAGPRAAITDRLQAELHAVEGAGRGPGLRRAG